MQTSYNRATWVNGQLADGRPQSSLSPLNQMVAQESRVSVSGTTDGVYTVQIESEEGVHTISFTASSDTTLEIVQGLEAAADANDALVNVLVATAVDAGTDYLKLAFIHPGRVYTVTLTADAAGSSTVATQTAAGGTDVRVGCAVVRGSAVGTAAAPTSASVDSDVIGIAYRGANVLLRDTAADNTQDRYAPGDTMDVLEAGSVICRSETAWTDGGAVYVRRIATGTEVLGALRASGDGTARVLTGTPTAANATVYQLRLDVDKDGNGEFKSYTIGYLSDGSGTATEICDGLRAELALITELTGVITGTGTATLILTGAAGVSFEAASIAAGVVAIAETTAGTLDTFKLKNARFEGSGSANGLAKVVLSR